MLRILCMCIYNIILKIYVFIYVLYMPPCFINLHTSLADGVGR